MNNGKAELDLGVEGLQIIDRSGKEFFAGLTRVRNAALLSRMRKTSNDIVSGVPGLDNRGNDVVAYAAVPSAHWWIAIDRPVSVVYAAARRSLYLELGSLAAAALVILGVVSLMVRRHRREQDVQAARASASNVLSRALAAASTQNAVSDALLDALVTVFPDSLAVVAFDTTDGLRIRVSKTPSYAWIRGCPELLEAIARHAMAPRQTLVPEQCPRPRSASHRRQAAAVAGLQADQAHRGRAARRDRPRPPGAASARRDRLGAARLVSGAGRAGVRPGAEVRSRARPRDATAAKPPPRGAPGQPRPPPRRDYRAGSEGVEVGGDWYDAVGDPTGSCISPSAT